MKIVDALVNWYRLVITPAQQAELEQEVGTIEDWYVHQINEMLREHGGRVTFRHDGTVFTATGAQCEQLNLSHLFQEGDIQVEEIVLRYDSFLIGGTDG